MILLASCKPSTDLRCIASSEAILVPRVPENRHVSGGNFVLGSPKVARLTIATL